MYSASLPQQLHLTLSTMYPHPSSNCYTWCSPPCARHSCVPQATLGVTHHVPGTPCPQSHTWCCQPCTRHPSPPQKPHLHSLGLTWIHFDLTKDKGNSSESKARHKEKGKGAMYDFAEISPGLPLGLTCIHLDSLGFTSMSPRKRDRAPGQNHAQRAKGKVRRTISLKCHLG